MPDAPEPASASPAEDAESPLPLKTMSVAPARPTAEPSTAEPEKPAEDGEPSGGGPSSGGSSGGSSGKDGPEKRTEPPRRTAGSSSVEQAVIELTNAERADEGCDPLHVDQRLMTAAERHSADMAANDYFSHTSQNGDTPWKRMGDAGYPSPGAENIAKGYGSAEAVVRGWMNSPGHRRNILNCGLRAIGVGMVDGPGGKLWTQNFGWK